MFVIIWRDPGSILIFEAYLFNVEIAGNGYPPVNNNLYAIWPAIQKDIALFVGSHSLDLYS